MSGKNLGLILGVVLLVVGLLGLVGGFGIVGSGGFFATNSAHDWIHIITGLVFIVVAMKFLSSLSLAMKIFGGVYILVALLGFVMPSPLLGLVEVNGADNILHLVLGAVFFWAGWMAGKSPSMPMSSSNPMM